MNWENRSQKQIVRNKVIAGRNFKSALLLPSYSMLDVELGFKKRAFKKYTKFTFIEYDEKSADLIEEKAKAMNLDFELYRGRLENFVPEREYDMVYLDFVGPMSKNKYHWIKEYNRLFTDKFAITLNTTIRWGIRQFNELKNHLNFENYENALRVIMPRIKSMNGYVHNAICSAAMVQQALYPKRLKMNSFLPYKDGTPMVSISGRLV